MKNTKQSGITLLALVVTIVVLLILAGVSINLVLGQNGLITQAQEAKKKTIEVEKKDKESMDSASDWISETANETELPTTATTKPYMPSREFTKVEGTNLANGLVIEDKIGNQYVWVEVPMSEEVYLTAGLNIKNFDNAEYEKIENDLHNYTRTYRNNTEYNDKWYEDTKNTNDWYTEDEYNEAKEKMLKNIYKNGGFWVARYEAGTEKNRTSKNDTLVEPQSKPNLYPYIYVTTTQAKKVAEMVKYTNNETTYTGSLMFGVQWDLVLAFMHNKGNVAEDILNLDSTYVGNYRNSTFKINRGKYVQYGNISTWYNYTSDLDGIVSNGIKSEQSLSSNGIMLTTGAADKNSIMNIYDIAGNVYEWTLEYANSESNPSTSRGGYYSNFGFNHSASYRYGHYITASNLIGFRITLL